jgi:hypothetical protein
MTQTSGSLSIIWSQLVYIVPTILVAIAAIIVCVMNWQKAPTAATFCLIGFGLIGSNAVFGVIATSLFVQAGSARSAPLWSLVTVARMILNTGGLAFLLIAIFSGRNSALKQNIFESTPNQSGGPQ